jgi:glycosyltransferase involved in cell wall biosynthesis
VAIFWRQVAATACSINLSQCAEKVSRPLRIWLPAIRAGSGTDVFVIRLAQALRRAGHEPFVEWFDHRYELMPWLLTSARMPDGIDVTHANSWQGFAFKRSGIPLVVTEHQYVAHPDFSRYQGHLQRLYHRWFIETWMRMSFDRSDAIIAVSKYIATQMCADIDQKVEVIHNWVDINHFTPFKRGEKIESTNKALRLLFVGNPAKRKGSDLLLNLASMLGDGFDIYCLGGLRQNFKLSKLPSNVRFISRVLPESMPDIYRMMDVALVPTRYEPFGYVALEAMACGLPVLGFDSSGTAEVCVHGETALLSSMDNLDQLVVNAWRLAEDHDLRGKLGAAGRFRAVRYFNEKMAIKSYLNVYKRIMRQ